MHEICKSLGDTLATGPEMIGNGWNLLEVAALEIEEGVERCEPRTADAKEEVFLLREFAEEIRKLADKYWPVVNEVTS